MAQGVFKVRLVSVLNNIASTQAPGDRRFGSQQVIFENTPTFSESGGVEYTPVQPVHMPGAIQVYKNTQPRTFSITHKFISRTTAEATANANYVQLLRSWRFPFFGKGSTTLTDSQAETRRQLQGNITATQQQLRNQLQSQDRAASNTAVLLNSLQRAQSSAGFELLGAPPEVLYLYAYSAQTTDRVSKQIHNINRVPVVLTNLDINYPEDVDYIPSDFNEPCPVRWDISITLAETHSPTEFENFSLVKYKTGQLDFF